MTNPEYTHVTLVVDRSGSMMDVAAEAQGGINALIAEQFALDGKLTLTLTQFDNAFETVARMAQEPFEYRLEPRGMTALLDAVGQEVVRTGQDLAALAEADRPGKVLLVIVTDGDENSSHEYTLAKVREMLATQQERYGWAVQFLGADDAAWQGEALGVGTTRYAQSATGNTAVFAATSAALSTFRGAPPAAAFAMPESVSGD